jgi:DNA polymerase-3 subunit epsilon
MSDKLSEDEKRKILCEIQLLKVDKPNISQETIAFEVNKQGFRRAGHTEEKPKLWNKGTIGHLIKEGENKSNMLNPVTAPVEKFELDSEMSEQLPGPAIKQPGKKILFFDTETTGLSADARIIQIAWVITDINGALISESDFFITPDNFTVPDQAVKIHGITTEKALKYGKPIKDILGLFIKDASSCDYIAGHNINYDIKRLDYEMLLLENRQDVFKDKGIFCTMLLATNHCKLPGKYEGKFKWPNLEELYKNLFQTGFANAHNALADIKATVKCFFELKNLEVIIIKDGPGIEIINDKQLSDKNKPDFFKRIAELKEDKDKPSFDTIAYLMGKESYLNEKGKPLTGKVIKALYNESLIVPDVKITDNTGPENETVKEVESPAQTLPETDNKPVYNQRDYAYKKIKEMNDLWAQVKEIKKLALSAIEKLNPVDKKILIYDCSKNCKDFTADWTATELFSMTPKNITEIIKGIESGLG